MKSSIFSFVFTAVLILFAMYDVQAGNPYKPGAALRDKVIKYLDRPSEKLLNYNWEVAEVEFMITSKREIVVLNVTCRNDNLEDYIKSKLNYKHVNTRDIVKLKPYSIRITFSRLP